ncbi:hypothetical protein ETAA8_58000 [Anatilimnocola aggregata]|uniref:Uncharacterized protein n=1 Tax=Anatilimnocola aggregata TaxID=2528021 RepID=A0A517YKA6_9BACT|nr:hypothetical protein ETAA8_58000 [Anatilimnocola aggregata]
MRQAEQRKCPNCGNVLNSGANDTFRQGDSRVCLICRTRFTVSLPLPPLDKIKFGCSLAERVANFLQAGGEIPSRHPYFDEVCLARIGSEFLYGYANQTGAPAVFDTTPVISRFANRAAFVDWLANQSDDSLNQ